MNKLEQALMRKKIDRLIDFAALLAALYITFLLLWWVTLLIPDWSFMSGLKIRWWIPAFYFCLPLSLLSLITAWSIKKRTKTTL